MLKFIFTSLLVIIITEQVVAQSDGTKKKIKTYTIGQALDQLLFNDQPNKIYREPSAKKNTIYFQAIGDTPWVGIGYSRRLLNKPIFLLEVGGGLGFAPHIFNRRQPPPKDYTFSHHLRFVLRPSKQISPTVTYAGVWVSEEFFKNKTFNYRPTPMIGVRLGNSNSLALNFNWCGYFYKQNFISIDNGENVIRGYKRKLQGLPSANIQLSF